ncbi:GSCOCG00001446001-RA-CDS [Cotesia congregata]|nr:GSCOCG00001446001-RA-CDS [Cotesia congregata]
MTKLVLLLTILLLVNGVQPFIFSFLCNIQNVISMATDLSDLITGRHDLTSGNLFKKKVDPTLEKVTQLSEKVDELTKTINIRMDKLMTAVLTNVPRAMKFANLMRKLIDYITRIDELYEDYQYYVHKKSKFNRYTVEDFSRVMTSHRFGDLQDILRQIYHLFIPGQLDQRDESLLNVMVATLKDTPEAEQCGMAKSSQQQLYDLYETVVLTEIKGFTMAGYAYGLLTIYENSTFESEVHKLRDQLVIRCSQYLLSIDQALVGLSREFFNCDPPRHVEGETYSSLGSFFRVIVHEYMMTREDYCPYTCETLETFYYARQYSAGDKFWYPRQKCEGYMANCINLGKATFCELGDYAPTRYSWVESSLQKPYGTKDQCLDGRNKTLDILRNSGYECSTCFCECSGHLHGIKTISMRSQMADIDKNMIVTGIKFEEKEMIFHVQIEQGKLQPGGRIDRSSLRMKELENIYYTTNYGGFVEKENPDDPEEPIEMIEGNDYIFISSRYRRVNLDRVYSQEPGYIVTGVKLSLDPDEQESLYLEVNITPFDFDSGMLTPTDDKPSKWINYKDMSKKDRKYSSRTKIEGAEKNIPINYYDNVPSSEDFAVLTFGASHILEDLGVHTVPFLDRRLMAPRSRILLEGISLMHLAKEGSGGFLGFRVTTLDIPNYSNPQMSEQDLEYYSSTYESKALNHPPEEVE